jgi:hypothetical protein
MYRMFFLSIAIERIGSKFYRVSCQMLRLYLVHMNILFIKLTNKSQRKELNEIPANDLNQL